MRSCEVAADGFAYEIVADRIEIGRGESRQAHSW